MKIMTQTEIMKPKIPGHSGCTIEFLYEPYRMMPSLIKKGTHDAGYAKRLIRQSEKQNNFLHQNTLPCFTVPKVISRYEDEREAFFIMEFCKSMDFIDYLSVCGIEGLEILCSRLISLIEQNLKGSVYEPLDRTTVTNKVTDVCEGIMRQPLLEHQRKRRLATFLEQEWNETQNWKLPVGTCHGDLTFSNLLFKSSGEQIVLIDFLDNFIESPLQDIVKIRQDTCFFWSMMLVTSRSCDTIKIKTALKYIDKCIERHFEKYEFYRSGYRFFQILNFARIVPYVKSQRLMNYVEQTMLSI